VAVVMVLAMMMMLVDDVLLLHQQQQIQSSTNIIHRHNIHRSPCGSLLSVLDDLMDDVAVEDVAVAVVVVGGGELLY
jgi:hypothetical protein